MDEPAFWRIVEDCRREAGPDTERAAQLILRRLRTLTPQEILDYETRWFEAQDAVFTWPVRDAAALLFGGVDEDTFSSVQDWIVSHGRPVLERIAADPDRLVDLTPDRHNARLDWFCGLPFDAHIGITGAPPPIGDPPGAETPTGEPSDLTDEAATRRRYPLITAYLDANRWIARPY